MVFQEKAQQMQAPIFFAEEEQLLRAAERMPDGGYCYQTSAYADLKGELGGLCQLKITILSYRPYPALEGNGLYASG